MASWAVISEQVVWISPLASGFTVVCERCSHSGDAFASVHGTLALEHVRGSITCPRGHEIRVERDGR
ncbi:MAG: hypothetical protein QOE13_1841 [Gaiellaceae bacterium]|jgi:hypothetical protein|nr:hypothetical protein [Gaiellaceae bacterium]